MLSIGGLRTGPSAKARGSLIKMDPKRHRPAARITLNGKDVTTNWESVLVSITVTDEAGLTADTCEAVFDNRELFTAPPIGGELKVWLGYEPSPKYVGSYTVDSWTKEGPIKTLTVSASAADFTSELKAAKTRSHHDTTVGDIVRQIGGEHGLSTLVDGDLSSRPIAHIDQQTESDLGFLSRLAKRQGATFKLADGKILFVKKGSKKLASGRDKPQIALKPGDVSTWTGSSGERGDYKAVKAAYMDHPAGKRTYVTAGSGTPCHRDKRLYGSKSEAQAAAAATLGDLQRGKRSFEFDGPGNPDLFAEAIVSPKGFDPDVDGDYLVKTVTHSFSGTGYRTNVTAETEGANESAVPEDVRL